MKKIENLEELQKWIGMETVEKCVTEYMMLLIGKARQVDTMVELWERLEMVYGKVSSCAKEQELKEFYNEVSTLLLEYHKE